MLRRIKFLGKFAEINAARCANIKPNETLFAQYIGLYKRNEKMQHTVSAALVVVLDAVVDDDAVDDTFCAAGTAVEIWAAPDDWAAAVDWACVLVTTLLVELVSWLRATEATYAGQNDSKKNTL